MTPWYLLPLVRTVLDQSFFPWWWTVTGYISEFSYSPFEVEDTRFYVDNLQKANLCRVLCLSFFQFQNVDIGENCASFRVFVVFFPLLQPSEALWGLYLEYFSA